MRALPKTVKQDKDAAFRLINYFFKEAPKAAPCTVRAEAENDAGGWGDDSSRSRYLNDFVEMASAGLFPYDTDTSGAKEDYFLVAFPNNPLRIDQLPPAIRDLVGRTRSPFPFSKSAYVSEIDTRNW